jgi:bacterioferritin (cytochrome b1)
MISKKQKDTFIKKLKGHVEVIAKNRDAIRDLISEFEEICENCDEAIDELESALDTLSQHL